jgi:hypothetical protein
MISDNALTYIVAAYIFKNQCKDYGMTLKFKPPRVHWYGCWFRKVNWADLCLKKVLRKSLVSMEVLHTLIAEVECIINDRPLHT